MLSAYFLQSVTLESYTETVGTVGTPVRTWTTASVIDALIRPSHGNMQVSDGKDTFFATHVLYCGGDTTISTLNRVYYNSQYFKVLSVKDPNTLGHHKEVMMQEVK